MRLVIGPGTRLRAGTKLEGTITRADEMGVGLAIKGGKRYFILWGHIQTVNGKPVPREVAFPSRVPARYAPDAPSDQDLPEEPAPPAEVARSSSVAPVPWTKPSDLGPRVSFGVGTDKPISLRFYGFLMTSFTADSTQSFLEASASGLVQKRTANGGGADNFAGKHPRTMLSNRGTDLGVELSPIQTASGITAKGRLEMDFMGNDAVNTAPGANGGPPAQTENNFFSKPAIRFVHAFAELGYHDWGLILGQTFTLFGWAPYYFQGESTIFPGTGGMITPVPQIRLKNTRDLGDDWVLESAAGMARPAAMNSGLPEGQAGVRVSWNGRKSVVMTKDSFVPRPLSIGVTGVVLPVRTDAGNANGTGVALDFTIPLLAPASGTRANGLSLLGELVQGQGIGNVEMALLTFGVPGVTAANGNTILDAGLAGVNAQGNVELIAMRSFRGQLSYVFPDPRWSSNVGYTQIEARNLSRFSSVRTTATQLAPKLQYGFVNVAYDPWSWLRLAVEFNQSRDTYNDPANRFAVNNRWQFSSFLRF